MPDAAAFGDEGADTLGNISRAVGGLKLPNLRKMGLGNIAPLEGIPPVPSPSGAYGKMAEKSVGKDTTVGHWEIAGFIKEKPFPVYPDGFPSGLVKRFEEEIGRKTLGNYPASGTAIITELGEEHLATGFPIIYTSADSVFQVAAHEEVIPPEELYDFCRKARKLLQGKNGVARVIARPFIGKPGNFTRTAHRHDFSLQPPQDTLLDVILENGMKTCGVGKIHDIFAGRGIFRTVGIEDNMDGVNQTLKALDRDGFSLIFTNLVDFDMKFGHRRNPRAYADALEEFDRRVPDILSRLRKEDILFIAADHGCDPTFAKHTDHTREYIPLLVNGTGVRAGVDLNTRETFADIAQTIGDYLNLPPLPYGTSFLEEILRK